MVCEIIITVFGDVQNYLFHRKEAQLINNAVEREVSLNVPELPKVPTVMTI